MKKNINFKKYKNEILASIDYAKKWCINHVPQTRASIASIKTMEKLRDLVMNDYYFYPVKKTLNNNHNQLVKGYITLAKDVYNNRLEKYVDYGGIHYLFDLIYHKIYYLANEEYFLVKKEEE